MLGLRYYQRPFERKAAPTTLADVFVACLFLLRAFMVSQTQPGRFGDDSLGRSVQLSVFVLTGAQSRSPKGTENNTFLYKISLKTEIVN
jgi:hypothetical protein